MIPTATLKTLRRAARWRAPAGVEWSLTVDPATGRLHVNLIYGCIGTICPMGDDLLTAPGPTLRARMTGWARELMGQQAAILAAEHPVPTESLGRDQ